MTSVVRRGPELRRAVRQRRRARSLGTASMAILVCTATALVIRSPDGLGIAMLCVSVAALLAYLVTFLPMLERRALRADIARPPLTRAQARRWAYGVFIAGALVLVGALIVGALTDAWLAAVAVAVPTTLLSALFSVFIMLRAAREGTLER